MKDSIIAKVAAQTSDFYNTAVQAANVTAARQLFDKVKMRLIRAKRKSLSDHRPPNSE